MVQFRDSWFYIFFQILFYTKKLGVYTLDSLCGLFLNFGFF